jgi:Meiotically up-regulated gene 113
MSDYRYKNIPLSPSIAAEHVLEFISSQVKPVRRGEIVKFVAERHRSLGGLSVSDTEMRVKRALNRLVDENKLSRPSVGWYSAGDIEINAITLSSFDRDPSEMITSDEVELIVAEETVGSGDELVYVYFSDADRKVAKYEHRDWWPCKVGYTAGNLTSRILAQGPLTSMARLPIVGLVIRTDDGHALERALHYALDESGARIAEALGSEWFDTSSTRIKAWHEKYLHAVDVLRR